MIRADVLNLSSKLFGKKWRMATIYTLKDGPLRFSQIKIFLPGCSVKMLSEVLDDLEHNELIIRTQHEGTIPVKVTYTLHPDMFILMPAQENYYAALKVYFIKYAEKYHFSAEIIKELQKQ